jgi:hypothetical protein
MGLLTHEERDKLVSLLLKLPNQANPVIRRQLYAGLPHDLQYQIVEEGPPRTHFASIVNTLDDEGWIEEYGGNWPILQMIERAIDYVGPESPVGYELNLLLTDLKVRAQQPLDKQRNSSLSTYPSKSSPDISNNEMLNAYTKILQEIERSFEFTDRRNYTRAFIDNIIEQLKQVNAGVYHLWRITRETGQTPNYTRIRLLDSISREVERAEKELLVASDLLASRDRSTGSSRSFYEHLSNCQYSLRSALDSLAMIMSQRSTG